MPAVKTAFFNRDACLIAQQLLGKIIRRKYRGHWLAARIIETEAYYLDEKASHASLGYTEKRKALFMPAGTIYMYYARGKDSLNVSCKGKGNAVLIKSAYPFADHSIHGSSLQATIKIMQQLNPAASGGPRPIGNLCKGQTLLCQSLDLKVKEWDQKQFDENNFFIDDVNIKPVKIIQTTRLGIPTGRDEHLPYRFIDYGFARYCTSNPLTRRNMVENTHYTISPPPH
ncbi:MAG: DNA-3-methyladenine glycosylase [Gammaproteobacteria bacterium]|jgi:DNA-3-methyladenine glycosylase|nr:DNA-3-methyladenine glycosylase [Gammaproteobacteria bacterium]